MQQLAITVAQTFEAFVGHASVPLGPLLYIVDLSKPSEIAHMSFFVIEITISDFILVRAKYYVYHLIQSNPKVCRYIAYGSYGTGSG